MMAVEKAQARHYITGGEGGYQFTNKLIRPIEKRPCDAKTVNCPKCKTKTRKTASYERVIDHMTERVFYEIHYYYCDECKCGWPSIPIGTLPNITVGLDVIEHAAYWHIMKEQSYETIAEHFEDCHDISRSPRTFERYVERFAVLIQPVLDLFDDMIRTYLKEQKESCAMYDESFFPSRFKRKTCLALLFIPKVRVIAAVDILKKKRKKKLAAL